MPFNLSNVIELIVYCSKNAIQQVRKTHQMVNGALSQPYLCVGMHDAFCY